ncbi:putative DNA-binding domain-containing protein [Pseudahrensia aquimaris]|uniref:DNA-binding domain-containing protein n=1 Tax=Pseudahrensia aquimaris TaxID=744461 RepID=A0ABW3FHQ8_9HYPH
MSAQSPHWPSRSGAFAGALLDPDTLVPDGVGKDAEAAPKRFSVYRNNVVVSLMEALAAAYPSTKSLLGDENFDRIARAFVALHPPQSPMMQNYGAEFPQFTAELAALSELPFVADLTGVEWAWNKAYHALDQEPLTADELAGLTPEQSTQLTLLPSNATHLIRSQWCVFDLFQCRFEPLAQDVDFNTPQNVLITRSDFSVQVIPLSHSDSACLASLLDGEPLGKAVANAMEIDAAYNPAELISLSLQFSLFQTLRDTSSKSKSS